MAHLEEHLGRELAASLDGFRGRGSIDVVNELYAAAFELAHRTGQTPRTVFDVAFADAPPDEEWRRSLLPLLDDAR